MVSVPFASNSFKQTGIQLAITLWGYVMKYCITLDKNASKSFTPVNAIYEASKAPDFFL